MSLRGHRILGSLLVSDGLTSPQSVAIVSFKCCDRQSSSGVSKVARLGAFVLFDDKEGVTVRVRLTVDIAFAFPHFPQTSKGI